MKYHPEFQELIGSSNTEEVFEYLTKNLTTSVTSWDYFINWDKVFQNVTELEVQLNTLNYLVGKDDVRGALKELLQRDPSIVRAIPALLAYRYEETEILTEFSEGRIETREFSFRMDADQTEDDIDKIVEFADKTGLLELFRDKRITSVPDYAVGVEAGLDTNARKNRGGKAMENVLKRILLPICQEYNFDLMEQATKNKLEREWDIEAPIRKTRRRFDFAIRTPGELYLVEANFYKGGGTKLKATAGEYTSLQQQVGEGGHTFMWITDGPGWETTLAGLEEAFHRIDYVLNLRMVTEGILEAILIKDS